MYGVENYLIKNMPGKKRSAMFKFGVDESIKIETERYVSICLENRLCFNCNDNKNENMFDCNVQYMQIYVKAFSIVLVTLTIVLLICLMMKNYIYVK